MTTWGGWIMPFKARRNSNAGQRLMLHNQIQTIRELQEQIEKG